MELADELMIDSAFRRPCVQNEEKVVSEEEGRIYQAFSNNIYPGRPFSNWTAIIWRFHMSDSATEKVRVVYENGVFKPLQEIELREGTKAFVVLKAGKITDAARRFRVKVDRDVMQEFVEERR
jgi:predicted DNA-binding antitoxin AbrB/MazE fold protein